VKRRLLLATALAAAAFAAPAAAAPGLLLGVDDDSIKWTTQLRSVYAVYANLGVGAVRVTLDWTPGELFPSGSGRTELARIGAVSRHIRVVLAIGGPASSPPTDGAGRASYCTFAANVLRRFPAIRDVAIWTEPNSGSFWKPQHDAAADYEALLAACWDTLHAVQPDANVIATSSPHHDPASWYRKLGDAYRASGRMRPIFDTVGHNAYPENSAEPPAKQHAKGSIDEGDLERLLASLSAGFAGSAQPLPGHGGVTVWYLEDGFQSAEPVGRSYEGRETDKRVVSEQTQAEQLAAAVRLAYCQPDVSAFFNFELRDEPSLSGWQSGLLRPDWSVKPAFTAYVEAASAVRTGSIDCATK
jgi:hypothetical protein